MIDTDPELLKSLEASKYLLTQANRGLSAKLKEQAVTVAALRDALARTLGCLKECDPERYAGTIRFGQETLDKTKGET